MSIATSKSQVISDVYRLQGACETSGYSIHVAVLPRSDCTDVLVTVGDAPLAVGYVVPYSQLWQLWDILEDQGELVNYKTRVAEVATPISTMDKTYLDSILMGNQNSPHFCSALSDGSGAVYLLYRSYNSRLGAH